MDIKDTTEMLEEQFSSDYGFWRDGKYIELDKEEAREIVAQVEKASLPKEDGRITRKGS